jgi:hypothetical protein
MDNSKKITHKLRALTAALLAATLLLSLLNAAPTASAAANSGTWRNITWSVVNGTLTISGDLHGTDGLWDMPDWYLDQATGVQNQKDIISSVIIGDGVTRLGEYAFYDWDHLTNVMLSDSITFVETGAFANCDSLTSIVIPGGDIYLDRAAFENCASLTNVVFGGSVKIGPNVFENCSKLANVSFFGSNALIGGDAFRNCTALTNISISGSVEYIGSNAFYGCSALSSILIPNGLEKVYLGAFNNCTNLTNFTILDSATDFGHITNGMGNYIFTGCQNLSIYGYNNSTAQIYADECDIPFIPLDPATVTTGGYGNGGAFLAPIGAADPNAIKIYTASDLYNIADSYGSYVLMNDIDLSDFNGGEWVPISTGLSSAFFSGTFDGQGHIIRNMSISGNSYGAAAGLFGNVGGGTLMNIGLVNSNINVQRSTEYANAGGIVGCVGYAGSSTTMIINSFNTGNVSGSGYSYVGGIVGFANSQLIIESCYNTSNISAGYDAGGIIGSLYGGNITIENSYNTGAVSADTASGGIIGSAWDLAGSSTLSIENCYNTGNIVSMGTPAGGVVGYARYLTFSIKNCYNVGDVSVNSSYSETEAGGIVGYARDVSANTELRIENCYNIGNVSAIETGGIIGASTDDLLTIIISNCSNAGNISGSRQAPAVGGMVGLAYGPTLTIESCYNTGAFSSSNSAGGIGGIVGRALYASSSLSLTIENCYYINAIFQPVGYSDSTPTLTNVLSLTPEQMQQQSSFAGFDFDTVWGIDPNINSGYPYLRALGAGGGNTEPTVPTDPPDISTKYTVRFVDWDGTLISEDKFYLAGENAVPPIDRERAGYAFIGWDTPYTNIQSNLTIKAQYKIVGYPLADKQGHYRYPASSGEASYNFSDSYKYADSYFQRSAYVYNHDLAIMSMNLAFSAFAKMGVGYENQSDNLKDLLEDTGFVGFKVNGDYRSKPTTHSIGVGIAAKNIVENGDDYTLLAVAIRGGGYEAEWASNFRVGNGEFHDGFQDASLKTLDFIETYINNNKITGKLKIWISGYSRGAATANLTAGALTDGAAIVLPSGTTLTARDIYAYCFETPAGAPLDKGDARVNYPNIFSIVNPNDVVPKVAPAQWGFGRYGITQFLPTPVNTKNYKIYKARMLDELAKIGILVQSDYKIDDFKSVGKVTQEVFLDKFIEIVAIGIFENKYYYNGNYEDELTSFIGALYGANTTNLLQLSDVLKEIPFLVSATDWPTLLYNAESIGFAHYPELCLAWLRGIGDDYLSALSTGNYRGVRVNCPVDIDVFDSEEVLVAKIVNDVPQAIPESTIVAAFDSDSQKVIYLPPDEDYTIKLTATGDGEMTYSIDDFEPAKGAVTRVVNYVDVPLSIGDKFTGTVESISDTSNISDMPEYTLVDDSGRELPEPEISVGDEIERYDVNVNVSGSGTATGARSKLKNQYIQLTATPDSGEEFLGWYANSELVSADSEYRFRVENDITLTAKFSVKNAVINTPPSGGGAGDSQTPTPTPTPTPSPSPSPSPERQNPFADITESDWFYADVEYVYANNLMTGVSATTFSPNTPMTRAMIVTVLSRLAVGDGVLDVPNPDTTDFTDVPPGQWYTDAVAWAAGVGIVSGVGGNRFAPDAEITRQDLAVLLARYADVMDIVLPATRAAAAFVDGGDVADYAKDAAAMLYGAGVVGGKPGGLFDPRGDATRAEVAAMLHRFILAAE